MCIFDFSSKTYDSLSLGLNITHKEARDFPKSVAITDCRCKRCYVLCIAHEVLDNMEWQHKNEAAKSRPLKKCSIFIDFLRRVILMVDKHFSMCWNQSTKLKQR